MSSVTEVFGGIGNWTLDLHPDTPRAVTQRLEMAGAGYACLIVTPVRIDHVAVGAENIHTASIYAGMYRHRTGRAGQLQGPGLWAYLGNEQGVGPIVGAGLSATKTYAAWVADLDLSPFIGTSSTVPTGSVTWTTDRVMTRREALEILQEIIGAHPFNGFDLHIDHRTMEITPEPPVWGHLAAAPYDDPATTPLFVPWWMPRHPGNVVGQVDVIRCRFEVQEHVEEYLYQSIVGGTTRTQASPAYIYPGGSPTDVLQQKYVDDGSIPAGSEATVGDAELDRHDAAELVVDCYSDERDIAARVKPGATVFLYDPENNLWDNTYPTNVAGREMWLSLNWVESMRWPIGPNMGVYVRFDDDSLLNLSEWYVPGTGEAQITFGAKMQTRVNGVVSQRGLRSQL